MKITSTKLASALLVILANLGCFCPLTFAIDPKSLPAEQSSYADLIERQLAPGQSMPAEKVTPPASMPTMKASSGQSASDLKNDKPSQSPPSVLFGMLERTNYEGWDPAELSQYRITDGRLVPIDPQAPKTGTADTGSLPLPLASNDVVPLAEFRCRTIVQKRFKRGSRYITIRAFQFDNSLGAVAGYDMLRKGSTTVIKCGDGSSDDGDSVSFWQSNFLFIISGTSLDDDESKGVIGVFAKKLSNSVIIHKQPPAIISKLPIVDRVRGSEKIVLGPVSAARVIQASSIDALMIEKALGAVVADYQVFIPARERLRLLYIEYGDAQLAESAYNAFINRQDELHLPEKGWPQDGRVLYRAGKTYLFCQLKPTGKLLLITGARKGKSPILLAGQVVER